VKLEHATLNKAAKATASVSIDKQTHTFPMDDVTMIVEARVDELLDYVDRELQKIRRSRKLPGGVILVGGTAKLPGIADFTREKLELPARVGKIQDVGGLVDTVEDASFTTVVGLMLLDMLLLPEAPSAHGGGAQKVADSAMGLVEGLFKRLKK
jgi:cell division protein FtsA